MLKSLFYASSPLAIACLALPAHAKESLVQEHLVASGNTPVYNNTILESNASFKLNASIQHSGLTSSDPGTGFTSSDNFTGSFTNSDHFIPRQESQASPSQNLLKASKESVHPRQVLKSASLLTESVIDSHPIDFHSIESIASTDKLTSNFLPNSIAQADLTPPPSARPLAEPVTSDRWQFSVAPYFFVPLRVRTDATVAGRSASINLGLGSILNFDRAFDAGIRVEAWKNQWGVIFDGFYISAKNSGNIGVTFPQGSLKQFGINFPVRVSADASLSVRQGTVDLAASYRVVDTLLNGPETSPNPFPRLVVAPILGLRTNILSQKLEVGNVRVGVVPLGTITLPVNQDFSSLRTFVEPLIGAQIGVDLSERWAVGLRGDVSGFNISADRNLTWNLLISTQYHFSPSTSLQLGYRFNNFDFEDGAGLRRTRVNLRQNGLLLSVIFRF
ncbi:hypothetical protein J5X98_02030 [Leptothermofonsia sichuanensis E412]|uniref:outer membrane protein n=1 Tax=Leptothermofonsia sichuanensis TaxID=2917832 RepID=UPI001CA740B9|nr:hypothetical protein [Leptothermofonsia sichuanensis]QZZ21290.1 hypothetical protein J5X98_02030 [Leptothermofonsia sichuanensis E412]